MVYWKTSNIVTVKVRNSYVISMRNPTVTSERGYLQIHKKEEEANASNKNNQRNQRTDSWMEKGRIFHRSCTDTLCGKTRPIHFNMKWARILPPLRWWDELPIILQDKKRTLVLFVNLWYNIISRKRKDADYMKETDHNSHSVYLLYYLIILLW